MIKALLTLALYALAFGNTTPDAEYITGKAVRLLPDIKSRRNQAVLFVPMYASGCSKCVQQELDVLERVRHCARTRIDTMISFVPVDRLVQFTSRAHQGQYRNGTLPDVGHELEQAIGSTPEHAKVLVMCRGHVLVLDYDTVEICRAINRYSYK